MQFDPLSRDLPPPRYEVESGSEDEHNTAEPATSPAFAFRGPRSNESEVIILIEQAGRACLGNANVPTEQGTVAVEGQQQASVSDTIAGKTVVFVSPTQNLLPSSRYHELAQVILDQLSPSSMIIVDSYSPASNVFRVDAEEQEGKLRYLAVPTFPQTRIDSASMAPLLPPESVTGLGAAFLTASTLCGTPALLALVESAQFQSHVQLYGDSSVRLSRNNAQALQSLLALSPPPSTSTGPDILSFAKQGRSRSSAQLTLGDGNMYI